MNIHLNSQHQTFQGVITDYPPVFLRITIHQIIVFNGSFIDLSMYLLPSDIISHKQTDTALTITYKSLDVSHHHHPLPPPSSSTNMR